MELPFNEQGDIRTFSQDVKEEELVWHKDREDRLVEIIGETDWKFQFDNETPQPLQSGLFIPKGVYHRIIKGTLNLTIKVTKL